MSNPTTSLEVQPPLPEYTEQNVSMVQQYATARIQSAYIVASKNPRNVDVIRQEVLRECSRPSFCTPDDSKNGSSLAIYRVPRGSVKTKDENGRDVWVNNNIEGPTIRFAEMLLRSWRYLSIEVNPMGEDDKQRLLQVICTDYQSCNFTSEIVSVPKTVERKKLKAGDECLAQRTNTYGDPVYLVKATDDELAMRTNALISKARRNLILQAVPGWLIEEGVEKVRETSRKKDAEDPDGARRKLFDAYATVGVSVAQIVEYLGHNNALSPAELEDLRGYYSGIREGATSWATIVASKEGAAGDSQQDDEVKNLFAQLEMTDAVIRRTKAKYVGNVPALVEYLTAQVAKKANDGGKKEATKGDVNPTKPSETTAHQPSSDTVKPTSTAASSPTEENMDAEPVEDEKPKVYFPSTPAVEEEGW
jgi:hypothetical protein